jgi:hypothetical protein
MVGTLNQSARESSGTTRKRSGYPTQCLNAADGNPRPQDRSDRKSNDGLAVTDVARMQACIRSP